MVVGGPNARSDYHLQTGEEFFLQLKGQLVLKVLENGIFRDYAVNAGEAFLLPSHVPHSPQRGPESVGLVFERSHVDDEVDGMLWYNPDGSIDYEEYFHCVDLGTQLKPIIERYHDFKQRGGEPSVLFKDGDRPIRPDPDVRLAKAQPFPDEKTSGIL